MPGADLDDIASHFYARSKEICSVSASLNLVDEGTIIE